MCCQLKGFLLFTLGGWGVCGGVLVGSCAIKTTLFTGKGRKNEESTGIIITLILLTLGDELSSKKMEEHHLDR